MSKKYELTAWDRIKYPTMAVGGLIGLLFCVGYLLVFVAGLLR